MISGSWLSGYFSGEMKALPAMVMSNLALTTGNTGKRVQYSVSNALYQGPPGQTKFPRLKFLTGLSVAFLSTYRELFSFFRLES